MSNQLSAVQQRKQDKQDRDWARHQYHLTVGTTGLTAAGAAALGVTLAGKTKAAGKILPKHIHRKLTTERADDIRNTIALAGMTGGVISGASWAKKLKRDELTPQQRAKNLAIASKADIEKGLFTSAVVRTIRGPIIRRGGYRRPPLRRPRQRNY